MTLVRRETPQARAGRHWSQLADRLRTITPEAVGRGLLTIGVIVLTLMLAIGSWPALAPFVAGAVIAYAVLPLANRLDRFMPRVLAAVLAELVALAVIVGVILLVVPPLLRGLVQIALRLPTPDQVQASLASLQLQLGDLPEPMRSIVLSVVTQVSTDLQGAMNGLVDGIAGFVSNQILHVAGTASFLLGLLVIPAWVLTVVADERRIKQNTGRLIAPAIRADVVAIVRIVDRAFGTLLRVQLLLAIVAGVLIWLGLLLAEALNLGEFPYAVTGATLLGALQIIPELGYFLGFFPILIVLGVSGPIPALTVLVIYIAANYIASALVETRVSRGVLDVHPGLLIPAIVVFSQFGIFWLLIAAPLVAVLRDAVRYLAGRLAEPAKPAGVLPGDAASRRVTAASAAPAPVPSAYAATTARGVRPTPAPSAPARAPAPSRSSPGSTASSRAMVAPLAPPTIAPVSSRSAVP